MFPWFSGLILPLSPKEIRQSSHFYNYYKEKPRRSSNELVTKLRKRTHVMDCFIHIEICNVNFIMEVRLCLGQISTPGHYQQQVLLYPQHWEVSKVG